MSTSKSGLKDAAQPASLKPYSWALAARPASGVKMTEDERAFAEFRDKKKFQLMALPSELRLEVLRYLPESNYLAVYLRGYSGVPTKVQWPTITRAGDRQLRQEAIMVTVEGTTFSIHSGPGNDKFQIWLTNTDLRLTENHYIKGYDAVKSLEFPYFARFPHRSKAPADLNNDLELAARCINLVDLSMTWIGFELVGQTQPGSPSKSVQELRTDYRLDRMLACNNLMRARLVKMNVSVEGEATIQDLTACLRAAFLSTPSRLSVEVTVL